MNKKIHDKDIDQEKQVFEVTIPKYNIEKLHMCVGNAYESSSTKNKYNIYNVDKNTRKVTECVGYYELDKGKEVMDKDGDFNVRALGEEAIELYPEFVSSYGVKPKKAKTTETISKKLPESVSISPKYIEDDQQYMNEYFDNKYDLTDEQIIPTYLKNFKKPNVWVNDVGVSLTGIFSNVYIIVVNEQFEYDGVNIKPSSPSTQTLDLNMAILPRNDELDYDKDRKYVLVSYRSQTHYRLIESNGKVLFSENELPEKIIQRFCTKHHPNEQLPDGVSDVEFPVKIIETTSGGDCFFDSIYRATKSVDVNAKKDAYLKEVHEYRKEIADGMESNPMAQRLIIQSYRVNAVQDVDTIRNKFYNDKFSRKATPEDDAVFKYAYSSIFGVNKHNEDDFSFVDKETILITYLTLLYEFFPDFSQEHQDEFKDAYNSLYGLGKSMNIKDSLEKQRTALSKSLSKPKEESKVNELPLPEPAPKPSVEQPQIVKISKVSKTAPKPAPVAPEPAPSAPEPKIDVSTITDAVTKEIVEIYLSSESQEEKKKKLDKFKKNKSQLESAWKIVKDSNTDLFRATPDPKNIQSYIDCLSGDLSEKCTKEPKQSKKASKAKGGKYTRKNI